MSDLLEHQPTPGTRRRRATAIVTCLTLAGAAVLLRQSVNNDHPEADGSPAASSSQPPATEPAPNPTTRAATPVPSGQPWPRAQGACGNDAALPLLAVPPLAEPTGLRVFVGGNGLRLVDIDTGRVQRVATPTADRQVTQLAVAAGRPYALAQPCSSTFSAADVLSVNRDQLIARRTALRGVDTLLAGPAGVWSFDYQDQPAARLVLHPIAGGAPLRMPAGFSPYTVTRRGFLGIVDTPADQVDDQPSLLAAVHRDSIKMVHRLGRGDFMAGADEFVLYDTCIAETRCVLTKRWSDGTRRRFVLPTGRVPMSEAVLSDDQRLAAFQLARSEPDPVYNPGHPGSPSDLAVLDLVTGEVQVLNGVEIAPKSGAGLAFSRDSRWLLITLNEGGRARLLVWHAGWNRPQLSPAELTGTVMYNVPVLDSAWGS